MLRSPSPKTFDKVAQLISDTCDIPVDQITLDSHAIEDLSIDSLAFLDLAFAIDKEFQIKLPLEKWTQDVNDGTVKAEEYFVLRNLCAHIEELTLQRAETAA
jgi:acyl carrier protein